MPGSVLFCMAEIQKMNGKACVKMHKREKETTKIIKEDLINAIADENGTGHAIYHDNVILAGKTGTAEIKQSQSDTTGTELGWFTVMTIDEKQPILMTTVVEDVKNRGGSGYVVEHTKAPLDLYLPQVSD